MPNLCVPDIAASVRASKAKKIYICNVMTQPGETDGYTVSDHVKAINQHAGQEIVDSSSPTAAILTRLCCSGMPTQAPSPSS